MWSVDRLKKRNAEAVSPAGTHTVAEAGAQTLGREAAKVIVVGPPGCCGCVGNSAGPRSRRER